MQLVGRGDDMLLSVLGVVEASRAQIAYMRELRLVCQEFKLHTDFLLGSTSWLQPLVTLGAEFRGNFAMASMENWPALFESMRELNSDGETQQSIMARFETELTLVQHESPRHPIFTHSARLVQLVAWAMRSHPHCHLIQVDGIHALSLLRCEVQDGNYTLTAYAMGSLAVAMHNNLGDLELQRKALQTLYDIISEVDDMFSDTGGVVMVDQAPTDSPHIDMLTLVQPAEHFIPNLVVRVMQEHVEDNELMSTGVKVLWHYMDMMSSVQRSCGRYTQDVPGRSPVMLARAKILHKFGVAEAEALLLTCMHRHTHKRDNGGLPNTCMLVLHDLIPLDFWRMRRVEDVVQQCINTAMQSSRSGDSMEILLDIFRSIMQKLSTAPEQRKSMQNFAVDAGMVQVYLMFVLEKKKASSDFDAPDESDYIQLTLSAFNLIANLCEDNAQTAARMSRADVLRIIDGVCTIGPKERAWHDERNRMISILSGSVEG